MAWSKFELRLYGELAQNAPSIADVFHQKYPGSRYPFAYPACPNLEDQTKLFAILHPEEIGITLTDTFQIERGQSTSAIVVHHPAAKYFVA
jgi:5-methyltetrahydrofolate--homocysteine methyltransferase